MWYLNNICIASNQYLCLWIFNLTTQRMRIKIFLWYALSNWWAQVSHFEFMTRAPFDPFTTFLYFNIVLWLDPGIAASAMSSRFEYFAFQSHYTNRTAVSTSLSRLPLNFHWNLLNSLVFVYIFHCILHEQRVYLHSVRIRHSNTDENAKTKCLHITSLHHPALLCIPILGIKR